MLLSLPKAPLITFSKKSLIKSYLNSELMTDPIYAPLFFFFIIIYIHPDNAEREGKKVQEEAERQANQQREREQQQLQQQQVCNLYELTIFFRYLTLKGIEPTM